MKTIAIDIGGTSIKSALCEGSALFMRRETPTEASLGGVHIVNVLYQIIDSYMREISSEEGESPAAIGISTAGQVDPVQGSIIYANQNIPDYTGTQLRSLMESRFHIPVTVENDVNAAAIGEHQYGAAVGEKDFICLTYGTGIGGAIFSDGKLQHGSSFSAGEFGAMLIHPEDVADTDPAAAANRSSESERSSDTGGNTLPEYDFYAGGYEKYASATALIRMAQQVDAKVRNGRDLFARKEELALHSVIDRWMDEVVLGLVNLTHILNPSCIVLGGGVMEQAGLAEEVERRLMRRIMPSFRKLRVKKATLGNDAGLLGAVWLASQLMK